MSNEKYLTVKELIDILEKIKDKDKLIGIHDSYQDCFCPFTEIMTDFNYANHCCAEHIVLVSDIGYNNKK